MKKQVEINFLPVFIIVTYFALSKRLHAIIAA